MVSREEAKKQLVSIGIENPTDEQVTAYLNNVNAEAIKEKSKADKYKEDADKAKDLEKQLEDLQNQNLSDADKAKKENEKLQQQIAELTSNSFRSEAKAILKGTGMEDADIETLIPGMIAGLEKVEDVQARANAYVSSINKIRDNAIKQHEKQLLDGTKTPGGKGGSGVDDKTEDVLNAEKISFGGVAKEAQTARDYYK